jgi:hypothetical protein
MSTLVMSAAFHLVCFSTALTLVTNMSEKCKCASFSAVQVKKQGKIIGIEEKLHVKSRHEKGERIVDVCCNVGLTHSSVYTIRDNSDRIKESAKTGTKVLFV